MVGLTKNTVGNVFAAIRHCCKRDLQDRSIIPFGGNVHIGKCDESEFKHKSKVSIRSNKRTISPIQCNTINDFGASF